MSGHELDIERGSDVPISTQIYWQLAYQIESGRLQPGTRLPPVRELGAALRVNPNTMRAVYRRLADAGYVVGRHGAGTRVVDRPPVRRGSDALAGIVAETLRRAAQPGSRPTRSPRRRSPPRPSASAPAPSCACCSRSARAPTPTSTPSGITEAFPDRIEADGRAARRAARAPRPLPLRPRRDDDVPRRRGPGATSPVRVPVVAMLVGPGLHVELVHEIAGLPPGSKVGLVCGSQRGVENIAEVLQLAGTTGVEIVSAVAHTEDELDRVDRDADIVLLSREAMAPRPRRAVRAARAAARVDLRVRPGRPRAPPPRHRARRRPREPVPA